MIATEKNYAYYPPEVESEVRPRAARPAVGRQPRLGLVTRVALVLALVVGGSLFLVARYTAVIERGYDLARLEGELAALRNENQRMQFAIGQLKSLARVEQVAVGKLGMVKAEEVRLVAFADGEVSQDLAQGQKDGASVTGSAVSVAPKPAGKLAAAFSTLSGVLTRASLAEAGNRP